MYEGLFRYLIPIMIGLVFVSFAWALFLTAVKPPENSAEKQTARKESLDWKSLDAGPEGVVKNITQKIRPRTKTL